jgi:hypothetical protein
LANAPTTKITGITGQEDEAKIVTDKIFGKTIYLKNCPANLVSHSQLIADGWIIKYLPPPSDCFLATKGKISIPFKRELGSKLYVTAVTAKPTKCPPRVIAHARATEAQLRKMEKIAELHRSLGHPNNRRLRELLETGQLIGTDLTTEDLDLYVKLDQKCESCIMGKTKKAPTYPSTSEKSKIVGQHLHVDILELEDCFYLISIDEATGHLCSLPLERKSESALRQGLSSMIDYYKVYKHTVEFIHSDRERGMTRPMVRSLGCELAQVSSEQHEKRAERAIQTLEMRCRSILCDVQTSIPKKLVNYLVSYATGCINLAGNIHSQKGFTPRYAVTGQRIRVDKLLRSRFGEICLFRTPYTTAMKLKMRTHYGMTIGRDFVSGDVLTVWDMVSNQIVHRNQFERVQTVPGYIIDIVKDHAKRDPIKGFKPLPTASITTPPIPTTEESQGDGNTIEQEQSITRTITPTEGPNKPDLPNDAQITPSYPPLMPDITPVEGPHRDQITGTPLKGAVTMEPITHQDTAKPTTPGPTEINPPEMTSVPSPISAVPTNTPDLWVPPPPSTPRRYSLRRDPKKKVIPHWTSQGPDLSSLAYCAIENEENQTFLTVAAAMRMDPHKTSEALKKELNQMLRRGVFRPVHRSAHPNATYIPSSVVMKVKPDGLYKARLVASGNRQDKRQYSASEVNGPAVRTQSILILTALSAALGLTISTGDIEGAYLWAPLERQNSIVMRLSQSISKILMEMNPEYAEFLLPDGCINVLLVKSLYGLIESAQLWNAHLSLTLVSLGFRQLHYDKCLFVKGSGKKRIFVGLSLILSLNLWITFLRTLFFFLVL